jgi:autotransporter-associated beta strand protein
MKKIPTQTLKKFFGLCGLLALIQSAYAQFTFPVYEPFSEYSEGDHIGKATSGQNADATSEAFWNFGNSLSTNTSPWVSVTNALNYPGLLLDPNSPAKGIRGPIGAGRSSGAPYTAQTSGTNYLSFLLNLQTLPSADRQLISLDEVASASSIDASKGVSVWVTSLGQLKFGIHNASPLTNTTSALSVGSTYFVVLAYKFTNNEVDLWLNPTVLGNDANIPAPTMFNTNSTSTLANPATLQSVCLLSPTGTALSTNLFDEIRVDNHWAGVTTTSPLPGPAFNVTGGGTFCPVDAFAIGLSGSVTTNKYLLYTNSAFSGQVVTGTGSAISFGPQSVSGVYTVVASNVISGNIGWMSGSATVFVLAGPSIITEPSPVLVATNGFATFSVNATGNNLDYQWYKNGSGLTDGGDISGSTTPVLTISPAMSADAATTATGYYVIITNSCGLSATSTTNALTLQPVSNLIWQGANPNTNWDLTTANWTNSAGSFVVFNSGDNVTFNNSSTNQVVTLVGSLAPTLISDNSGSSYFFTGSGSIVGSASLLMSGSGMLTISNANSYTGGTTISNGTMVIQDPNQMALGSGTVTLASGKLEIGLKSGVVTVGLSNINVTASSTLQIDGAGSIAFDVLGALTGSPGATLTIFGFLNNSATPDRVRLYGNFTNNAPIVISGNGDEVELAPYLPSGNQVYNGVISGNGGRFIPRGSGNAIFNAANTFNDSAVQANGNGPSGYSVLLSSGNVGVGADSVSSSPPTIDSSPLGTGILGIQVGAEGGTSDLFASGGAHTVANQVIYTSATNTVTLVFSGNNNLTLSGSFTLSGADGTGNTNRTLQADNTGLTTLSGVVGDSGLACGIIKTGTNTLVLSGNNTYTGSTIVGAGTLWVNGQVNSGGVTVTNGMLGGIGTILGPVVIQNGGTLAAGTAAIGTLTVNNNVTLNGNALFKVNTSASPSNDVMVVTGTLSNTGTGTLTVTNLGSTLAIGNTFKLFSKPLSNGSALTVIGAGMNWTNKLAVDGSIAVLSVANTIATNPTNILFSVVGGTNLVLSWPADHIGWLLQVQTNTLVKGLGTNWIDVTGTSSVDSTNFIINPANESVFYRLIHP